MLTPPEISILRLLKKTAVLLLLLLKLDRPVGESEIANILEIDRTTSRKYLQSLADLGIVTRVHNHNGYILTGQGRQMLLAQTDENSGSETQKAKVPPELGRISPIASLNKNPVVIVDSDIKQKDKLTTTITEPNGENFPHSESKSADSEEPLPEMTFGVRQAFLEAGIYRNDRTLRLATREYITPEYIRAHYQALKRADVDSKKITKILIRILERGEPAPKLNRNGHLADCGCEDCRRLYFLRCPDCHEDPCVCQVDEGEEGAEFEDETTEDAGDETDQAEPAIPEAQNV